ncbi:MAG: esterase family protein [Gammaproteobacteria bacterium]|nr:esterase family protein [Gammaproteobacteria bacterium]
MRLFILLALVGVFGSVSAGGKLSDDIRITSDVLGYDLQYRVYQPEGSHRSSKLPTLYITDGQWYISRGELPALLDSEIAAGNIEPVIVVFVDSRNPDNLQQNRRNQQFFCNPRYIDFFTDELLPEVDEEYPTSAVREDRVILGLSFGARNSACFGLMAHDSFAGIAMQSPANTAMVDELRFQYMAQDKLPLKIFMSVGTVNDNTQAGRQFMEALKFQEYDLTYQEVNEGHDWDNWGPLLDDVLYTFFPAE